MESVAEIIDKVGMSVFETKSLLMCIQIILEDDILNGANSVHLLSLVKITKSRFEKLQNEYRILEDKIYKQFLLNS